MVSTSGNLNQVLNFICSPAWYPWASSLRRTLVPHIFMAAFIAMCGFVSEGKTVCKEIAYYRIRTFAD